MNGSRIRIIAVLFVSLVIGCVEVDLVWLSDSSAFVYIQDKALVLYDVDRKAERTIVRLDWLKSEDGRPAVGPAGKRVALVRMRSTPKAIEYSILIFGMDGKPIDESPTLRVQRKPSEEKRKEETECGYAEWAPNGDNIVFAADLDEPRGLGIYNIRTHPFDKAAATPVAAPIMPCGRFSLFAGRQGSLGCAPTGQGRCRRRRISFRHMGWLGLRHSQLQGGHGGMGAVWRVQAPLGRSLVGRQDDCDRTNRG